MERVDGSGRRAEGDRDLRARGRAWALLTGRREAVAAALLAGVLVVGVALLVLGVVDVRDGDALTRAFAALIGGNMTLITIVISVNQLVISREFGTPADLRDRVGEMVDYRREAEALAGVETSPISPTGFLELLVTAVRDQASELEATVTGNETAGEELRATVEDYLDTVVEQTDWTVDRLQRPPTVAFSGLMVILDVDFTTDLHRARWLLNAHGESLSSDATDRLEDLVRLFELIGVLRQYLETLYLQRELALLSRRIFYAGIPAVLVSLFTIWVYGRDPGATVEGVALQTVVLLSAVVAMAPLAVFFAYIVRIATITRRTAALMPFSVRE